MRSSSCPLCRAISAANIPPVFTGVRALLIILIATGLVTDAANAQNANNPVRNAAAISLLQNSVTAMGGASAWSSVQDWTITGSVSTNGTPQASGTFSWKGSGNEFRVEVDTNHATSVFVSGHGTPGWTLNGSSSRINYHVARANIPYHLPGFCLQQELKNTQLSVRYVGATKVQGRPAIQVHVSDDSDVLGSLVTPHEWYFDPVSFLPLRVTFRLPTNENAGDYIKGLFDFAQFQQTNGVVIPLQISLTKDNSPTKVFVIGSAGFNSGLPSSTFDSPTGGTQ